MTEVFCAMASFMGLHEGNASGAAAGHPQGKISLPRPFAVNASFHGLLPPMAKGNIFPPSAAKRLLCGAKERPKNGGVQRLMRARKIAGPAPIGQELEL